MPGIAKSVNSRSNASPRPGATAPPARPTLAPRDSPELPAVRPGSRAPAYRRPPPARAIPGPPPMLPSRCPTRSAAAASGSARGNHRLTLVPRPGALSMAKPPPDCCAKPRAIARPSPVPLPVGLVVKNGSAARARVAASMPVPVSDTVRRTYSPASSPAQWSAPDATVSRLGRETQRAAARHGVAGIDGQVHQHRLQLAAIGQQTG